MCRYKLDGKAGVFGLPKVSIQFQVSLAQAYCTARHAVYTKLFALLVTDMLAELAYHAEIAELQQSVTHMQQGLKLHFYGYSN